MFKSLFTAILLLLFLSAKSQDFSINQLLELKSGDIEFFKKKYVGKGWSAPRRKLFQRKRQSNIIGTINPDVDFPELYLQYFDSKTKGFDSFVDISYFKDKKTPEIISWHFKSEKSFEKLMNSIKIEKFDKEWIDTVKTTGITLLYSYEKDDIHVRIFDRQIDNFYSPYYPKFLIELSHNFPRLFDMILSNRELLQEKSAKIKSIGPFIHYKELKIGGEVREVDEDFINEKIPKDNEYSVSGIDGISVVVRDGLIVKVNQRKKIIRN